MAAKLPISIVIPLYNKCPFVQACLRSVLAQENCDLDVIVVDDQSTDDGPARVLSLGDERIRLIKQDRKGVSAARNRGVLEAKCDVVAFLDADDEWHPDFCETINRLRQNFESCNVFATRFAKTQRDRALRWVPICDPDEGEGDYVINTYFQHVSKYGIPFCASSVAVKREAFLEMGGFPESVMVGEDLLTWARLGALFDIAYSPRICAIYWCESLFPSTVRRKPDVPDLVGRELRDLMLTAPDERTIGLPEFAAGWHRIRAATFMYLGDCPNALAEFESIREIQFLSAKDLIAMNVTRLGGLLTSGLLRTYIAGKQFVAQRGWTLNGMQRVNGPS